MLKSAFYVIAGIVAVLIVTPVVAAIKLSDSTILFSKTIHEDGAEGEGAEILENQIWYISNSTNWKPTLLISEKKIMECKLSPDGKNLLCMDGNRIDTFEYSFATKKAVNLFKGFGARYSPSGQSVAFISQRELSTGGLGRSVEIYDRKSKHSKVIAEGKPFPNQYHSVSWISDNEVAFISQAQSKPPFLLTFDMQGQKKRQISFPPNISNISGLALSPDGASWLFQATNSAEPDVSRIYTMHIDGRDVKKVYEDGRKLYHVAPTWAPDGRHIAFSSGYEGPSKLIILDLHSSDTKEITGFILDWGLAIKTNK